MFSFACLTYASWNMDILFCVVYYWLNLWHNSLKVVAVVLFTHSKHYGVAVQLLGMNWLLVSSWFLPFPSLWVSSRG